jgi:hypothetical protein
MSRLGLHNLRPREGREIINLLLTRGTAPPLSGGLHGEPVLRTGLRLGKDRHYEGVKAAAEMASSLANAKMALAGDGALLGKSEGRFK